jgi:hypothetical protein
MFNFGGMNVIMSPVVTDIAGDSIPELFVVPNDLGGDALAVVLSMNPVDSIYVVLDWIHAAHGATGTPAAQDIDADGRVEFIVGDFNGYSLYEWSASGLETIGPVGSPGGAMNYFASIVRPFPGREPFVILGYSFVNTSVFRYELLEPSGDNSFDIRFVFEDSTGYVGIHPSGGLDTDCDGLDELALDFPPSERIYGWNPNLARFEHTCGFSGSTRQWYPVDLDRNMSLEWGAMSSGTNMFYALVDPACQPCNADTSCEPPPPCGCECHSDPNCDGVRSDVSDVVSTIEVAFRGKTLVPDPSVYCPVERTDVDCDGSTNVIDVVLTVEVAFRAGDVASNYCSPCGAQ